MSIMLPSLKVPSYFSSLELINFYPRLVAESALFQPRIKQVPAFMAFSQNMPYIPVYHLLTLI